MRFSHQLWSLLGAFKQAGYRFCSFECSEPIVAEKQQIYLRHDIDFDCSLAQFLGEEEARFGIQADYYFLLRTEAYNLLSADNLARVKRLRELGHAVSLHFDPTLYQEPTEGLRFELDLFENATGTRPCKVSIHRPKPEYIGEVSSSLPIEHLYMKRYIHDMAYFSDSRGSFRYGHPLDSEAFKSRAAMALLIHPVWWFEWQGENLERLNWLADKSKQNYLKMLAANCIPFRERYQGE